MIQSTNSLYTPIISFIHDAIYKKKPENVSSLKTEQNKNNFSPEVKTVACIATGVIIGGLGVIAYRNFDNISSLFSPSKPPENDVITETLKTLKDMQDYYRVKSQSCNYEIISTPTKVAVLTVTFIAKSIFPNHPFFTARSRFKF